MSTEPQAPPAPPASTPGAALKAGWQQFKRGEVVSYRVMAFGLLLLAALVVFWFMTSQNTVVTSRIWLELEAASDLDDLKKLADEHPDKMVGKLAEMHIARVKLGPDGIDKLVTGDDRQRKEAVAAVEFAKEAMARLVPTWEQEKLTVLQAECYLGLAKAELALIGINRPGQISEFLGSPARAAEWFDKLAAVADGTPWGEDARKNAADLRKQGGPLAQDILRVQTNLYNMTFFPGRPGLGAMPFGPGGMPFSPEMLFPGGALPPGLSGIPGGGPVAPAVLPPGHP
jgi:hypothetical protein